MPGPSKKKKTVGKKPSAKKSTTPRASSPSRLIDERIQELGDWRGRTLAQIRQVIKRADPEVVEEWKWRGVPVWEHDGIICTGETYKNVVEDDIREGRRTRRSDSVVQLQPRREHEARH